MLPATIKCNSFCAMSAHTCDTGSLKPRDQTTEYSLLKTIDVANYFSCASNWPSGDSICSRGGGHFNFSSLFKFRFIFLCFVSSVAWKPCRVNNLFYKFQSRISTEICRFPEAQSSVAVLCSPKGSDGKANAKQKVANKF